MGTFIYEGSVKVDFEDRLLTHLQIVIADKLRRGEAFQFTWRNDPSLGDGRTSVWVHPHASLVYKYSGSRRPSLNRTWVDALARAANSPSGLRVLAEPAGPAEPLEPS
ncbi:ATP-dependent DNA ligase [Microbacterium sp.]|uniref:DUF7882 family protein n=1 Tax=Microbacterium sp. TaxID=51671 RepID=UPI003221BCB6